MKINKKVQKAGIIAGVLIVSVVIIGKVFHIPVLSTGVNTLLYPIEKVIYVGMSNTSKFFKRFQDMETLIAENKSLEEKVGQLQYENTILSQYQDENENLRNLLNMKKRFVAYEGTGANVIARDYGNWNKIYTIDKGLRQNVKKNSVVLANGGLVGHIEEVSEFSSKVVPIVDSRSAVSAEIVRTGDSGILKGDIKQVNDGLCVLEIKSEYEVMKGDQIITSYLSDVYPPGILIGTVEKVDVNNSDLVCYAYVKPVVDFEHLEQVLVINNEDE